MSFLSGKNAKVRIGAGPTTIKVTKWSVVSKVQALEVTNSESAGEGEYIGGIRDADVNLELAYNLGDALINTTFIPGTLVATVKLYLNDTGGVFWQFNTLYIEEAENTAEVRGLVLMKVKAKASAGHIVPVT